MLSFFHIKILSGIFCSIDFLEKSFVTWGSLYPGDYCSGWTYFDKQNIQFTCQGAAVGGYAKIGNHQDQVQGPTIRHEDRSLSCVSILLNWWMLLHFWIFAKVMMMAFTIHWKKNKKNHGLLFLKTLDKCVELLSHLSKHIQQFSHINSFPE